MMAANEGVAVVDSNGEISPHALAAAAEQTTRHALDILLWNGIEAVRTLDEIGLHYTGRFSGSSIRRACDALLLLMQLHLSHQTQRRAMAGDEWGHTGWSRVRATERSDSLELPLGCQLLQLLENPETARGRANMPCTTT
jgi:hypothetical protein